MKRWVMIVVVTLAGAAFAQPTSGGTSLRAFLDAADQQNVDRQISAVQRQRAEAELLQAWGTLFPSLTASAAWTHNQYESVISVPTGATTPPAKLTIQPQDQFDGVLRVDLPLVDVARWYRTLLAGVAVKGAKEREGVMLDLVHRQVVGAYYGYLAARALTSTARKSLAVAEAQLDLQVKRFDAGAVTELDLLRARAEVERNRQVIADAESLVATTRRSLQTLSGLEPGEVPAMAMEELRPGATPEELSGLEGRVEELSSVKAADVDVEAARTLFGASQLALVPSLSGQFTERFTNATGFSGRSSSYNAGLNLVWRLDVPTFQAMKVQDAAEQTATLAARRARLLAKDQVHSDWQRVNAARTKLVAAAAQVQAATRAAKLAQDRYEAGAATQVDVIQTERDRFAADVGQIQAGVELASARASLRISAGLPLFE